MITLQYIINPQLYETNYCIPDYSCSSPIVGEDLVLEEVNGMVAVEPVTEHG